MATNPAPGPIIATRTFLFRAMPELAGGEAVRGPVEKGIIFKLIPSRPAKHS